MSKISEIFNFDNIGGKIKKLAKWSCWITIILIWIGAVISYIGLIRAGTPYIGWFLLTPIIAMAGTDLVWFGSWVLYGFGELIDKTCDNENNTRQILKKLNEENTSEKAKLNSKHKAEQKAKHEAEKKAKYEAEEKAKCEAEGKSQNKEKEQPQRKVDNPPAKTENSFAETYWVCGKCKTKNLNIRNDCWSCGNPK